MEPPDSIPTPFDAASLHGWFLVGLGVVGVLFNGVFLAALCSGGRRLLRSSSSAFASLILNLTVADLGIAVCGCPTAALAAFYDRWIWGDLGCRLYGFQGLFFGLSSLMTVASLQIDRYLALSNQTVQTFRRCGGVGVLLIAGVWFNAFFWAAAPVYGWHQYGIEPSGVSCTIDYQDNDWTYVSYLFGLIICCYVLPIATMLVCEIKIRRIKSTVKPEAKAQPIPDPGHREENAGGHSALGLLIVFLFCWTPYAVVCGWTALLDVATLPTSLTVAAPLCAKMAPILNPVVIVATSAKMRQGLFAFVGISNGEIGEKEK